MKISGNAFGGQTLLGGERNIKMVEGFNLGNSPLEYSKENVSGKSIIHYTTNGSKAVVRAKFSENLFVCSFNNLEKVAQHLCSLKEDVEILCAGSNGMFCIEDTICAGKLISEIEKINTDLELSDSAKASVQLSKSFGRSISKMLKECEHGKLLIENGYEKDLEHCAKLNNIEIIPYYNSGVIKMLNSEEGSGNSTNAKN
jgi:2-phosphosulfolactate phosphatase